MKAMIFAAGLGTRLRPHTNDRPKALVEINGHTLLEIQITTLLKQGIREIILNIHHFGDLMLDYLRQHDNFGAEITVSDERDRVLETGGGLKKAAWFFREQDAPFLVLNVDVLHDLDFSHLLAAHERSSALATLAVRDRKTSRHLLFDEQLRLSGWENQKTGERKTSRPVEGSIQELGFSGIQIISPAFFKWLDEVGEPVFSIIPPYLEAAKTENIQGFRHDAGIWLDVGKPEALPVAATLLPRIHPEWD